MFSIRHLWACLFCILQPFVIIIIIALYPRFIQKCMYQLNSIIYQHSKLKKTFRISSVLLITSQVSVFLIWQGEGLFLCALFAE